MKDTPTSSRNKEPWVSMNISSQLLGHHRHDPDVWKQTGTWERRIVRVNLSPAMMGWIIDTLHFTDCVLDWMFSSNLHSQCHSLIQDFSNSSLHQSHLKILSNTDFWEPPPQGFSYIGRGMRPETLHLTIHCQWCRCYLPWGPHLKMCWFKPFFVHCLGKGIDNGNLRNNSEIWILNLWLWRK